MPRSRPGIIPYISDELFDKTFKTPSPPDRETPPLSAGREQEQPKGVWESLNDIEQVSSLQSQSSKAFAAPTAPMVFSNAFEESEVQARASTESSPDAQPPEPDKAQVGPSSAANQPLKVVRLQINDKQGWLPELRNEKMPKPAQIEPSPQTRPNPSASPCGSNAQQPKRLSHPSQPPNQADQHSLDSVIGPHASTTTDASKSGATDEVCHPSVSPQPMRRAKRRIPTYRDTPDSLTVDKRIKMSETADISKNDRPQGYLPSFLSHQAGRISSTENPSSKPRSKTQVPLWIITREPRFTEERWDEGKFQGSNLAGFLEDLSKATQRNHVEKVKLTLRTPTFDTKITVLRDAEDSWISAKAKFVEKLKEARADAKASRPNETANFEILVEPFYEEAAMMASNVDEDDEEFEF